MCFCVFQICHLLCGEIVNSFSWMVIVKERFCSRNDKLRFSRARLHILLHFKESYRPLDALSNCKRHHEVSYFVNLDQCRWSLSALIGSPITWLNLIVVTFWIRLVLYDLFFKCAYCFASLRSVHSDWLNCWNPFQEVYPHIVFIFRDPREHERSLSVMREEDCLN